MLKKNICVVLTLMLLSLTGCNNPKTKNKTKKN